MRVSFDLQVLVLQVPLLSLIIVTIYMFFIRTLVKNLMTVSKKNLSTGLTHQIFFHQTFGVMYMDLAITMSNKKFSSITLILWSIEVDIVYLSLLDLVRFCT